MQHILVNKDYGLLFAMFGVVRISRRTSSYLILGLGPFLDSDMFVRFPGFIHVMLSEYAPLLVHVNEFLKVICCCFWPHKYGLEKAVTIIKMFNTLLTGSGNYSRELQAVFIYQLCCTMLAAFGSKRFPNQHHSYAFTTARTEESYGYCMLLPVDFLWNLG
ncbi:hypothetical protein P3S68_000110 [Capsicum galapagoense]